MADFVAVLKKTIDAQENPDQGLRQRVYVKARSTIEQKLAAASAPDAVAQRQRQLLESAIEEVEAEYRATERASEEAAQAAAQSDQAGDPLEDFLKAVQEAGVVETPLPDEAAVDDANAEERTDDWAPEAGHDPRGEDRLPFATRSADYDDENAGGGRSKALIAGLIAVLLLGGVGYAGWTYQDKIKEFTAGLTSQSEEGTDAGEDEDDNTAQGENGSGTSTPQAPAGQTPVNQAPAGDTKPEGEPKLTQRLLPDGNEVDEGSAGDKPQVGEGTSNAPATTAPAASTPQTAPAANPSTQSIPVGQAAVFYEEQRNGETAAAVKGSVVWSVVQDSPGDGEPDEPAVRADATFPDAKVSLRMTIRRNADKSIPASHLIEMIYTVPDDFAGGAVENVQRVTFKDSEQAAGNPLAAIPMKIADNFFLVGLNDARTAVDMNLNLMRRQQWIDIPITYRNGRRALISLEKGMPGDKVFAEVMKSWSPATTGN